MPLSDLQRSAVTEEKVELLGALVWMVRNIHTDLQEVVKEISGDPDIHMVEDNE
jgi:hypothetical protein